MKKILILFMVVFITLNCTQNKKTKAQPKAEKVKTETVGNKHIRNGVVWYSNLEDAIKVAKKENKPILLQFSGSDWCRWCIKLNQEVFFTKEFADYAKDNIVLVNLDYPRSIPQSEKTRAYNEAMLRKYGIRGFPTVLLLDKNGNVVRQTGYRPGGPLEYIKHIKSTFSNK